MLCSKPDTIMTMYMKESMPTYKEMHCPLKYLAISSTQSISFPLLDFQTLAPNPPMYPLSQSCSFQTLSSYPHSLQTHSISDGGHSCKGYPIREL